jgi:hypothetical protein
MYSSGYCTWLLMTKGSHFTPLDDDIPDYKGRILVIPQTVNALAWITCLTSRAIHSHFPRSLCIDRNYRDPRRTCASERDHGVDAAFMRLTAYLCHGLYCSSGCTVPDREWPKLRLRSLTSTSNSDAIIPQPRDTCQSVI